MRAVALVLLLAVVLGGLGFLLWSGPVDPIEPGPSPAPTAPADPTAADTATQLDPAHVDAPAPIAPEIPPVTPLSTRQRIDLADLPEDRFRPFHGQLLLRHDETPPTPVLDATFDLDIVRFGHRYPQTVTVAGGRFTVEVPNDARVDLGSGTVAGERFHFVEPTGLFRPVENEYLLEAEISKIVTFVVRDGPTGAPLTDVTVARAAEATSARLGDGRPKGRNVLVKSHPSPVELPNIESEAPLWFHVSAPDYATSSKLIDVRKSGRHTFDLWPAADLDIAVTGPGRTQMRILVLQRELPGGGRSHAGTFGIVDPAVETGPSSLTFPIRGLAAVPHQIEVHGYNRQGQTFKIAETRVELGAGDVRSIEVYAP